MKLSSDSLFRFVTRFEWLADIIKAGFPFRPQEEQMDLTGYSNNPFDQSGVVRNVLYSRAICFCDIPLGQSAEHRSQYGDYAIAMTKEWAMAKGITPIRYYHQLSPDFSSQDKKMYMDMYHMCISEGLNITDVMSHLLNQDQPSDQEMEQLPESVKLLHEYVNAAFRNLLQHTYLPIFLTRVYQGEWTDRASKQQIKRRFYDEREWRAISFDPSSRLTFKLSDVRHIIVKSDAEKKEAASLLLQQRAKYEIAEDTKVWSLIKTCDEIYPDC